MFNWLSHLKRDLYWRKRHLYFPPKLISFKRDFLKEEQFRIANCKFETPFITWFFFTLMIKNNFKIFVKEEQQKQIKYRKLIICLYGTKTFKLQLKNSFSRFKWLQAIFMSMAVKMVIHKYCNLSHAQVRKRYLHLHKKQCRLSPTNIDIMPWHKNTV